MGDWPSRGHPLTNRTAELGPVSEEAGGAQRDEQYRGGQTKMAGPDAKRVSTDPGGDLDAGGCLQGSPGEIDAEPGPPRDFSPSMHAAPARSDPVRLPPRIEDLTEEGPARTGVVDDS